MAAESGRMVSTPTTTPTLRDTWLTPDRGRALMVAGPSLGTGVVTLWEECAQHLADLAAVDVLGWDLPGHGDGDPFDHPFTLDDLASAVISLVDRVRPHAHFVHAGVSVAGAVGLALAVGRGHGQHGPGTGRVRGSAVLCSGAKIGTTQGWAERAETVRRAGTQEMVEGSRQRWFAPGFLERSPRTAAALLESLQHADKDSYARVCEALGRADLRADLPSISVPVLVMGGRHDAVVDPGSQRQMASAIPSSTLVIVEDGAHLVPAECPVQVGEVLAAWVQELSPGRG